MGERIWVVDDSETDRLLTGLALRRSGVADEVVMFECAREALGRLREPAALPPTLILLDLHMPGFGGLEFLEALESRAEAVPEVPVAMLTASNDPRDRARCLAHARVRAFLRKPLGRQDAASLAGLAR
jgi:CheY-like chemotaxis protein